MPRSGNVRYRDLDLDFTENPVTFDVSVKTDAEAVRRSVRNLILLRRYDKPFHPEISSKIPDLLFEPPHQITIIGIQNEVRRVITRYEPRAEVNAVTARFLPDTNTIEVTIRFTVLNNPDPIEISISLQRLR